MFFLRSPQVVGVTCRKITRRVRGRTAVAGRRVTESRMKDEGGGMKDEPERCLGTGVRPLTSRLEHHLHLPEPASGGNA